MLTCWHCLWYKNIVQETSDIILEILVSKGNGLLNYEHLQLIWRESWVFFFWLSLSLNHAKLETHKKNSKPFIIFFNDILVSIAVNLSVGEVAL
jgi:hypothetical protein